MNTIEKESFEERYGDLQASSALEAVAILSDPAYSLFKA